MKQAAEAADAAYKAAKSTAEAAWEAYVAAKAEDKATAATAVQAAKAAVCNLAANPTYAFEAYADSEAAKDEADEAWDIYAETKQING